MEGAPDAADETLLSAEALRDLYRKRAPRYDRTANLCYLLGFREWAYRKEAIEALRAGGRWVVADLELPEGRWSWCGASPPPKASMGSPSSPSSAPPEVAAAS